MEVKNPQKSQEEGGNLKDMRMSKKEINQITVFDSIIKGLLKQKEAGLMLKLSPRQIRRKLKRYIQHGFEGLIHRNRGKRSNRSIPEEIKAEIIDLLEKKYKGFDPTQAAEKSSPNLCVNC